MSMGVTEGGGLLTGPERERRGRLIEIRFELRATIALKLRSND